MSSKFEYSLFSDGYFAVSKQKYTKEQAIEIFKREMDLKGSCLITVGSAFVRYRYGINDDNEPCSGWWIEVGERRRSCPAWVLSINNGWPAWPDNCELIKVEV